MTIIIMIENHHEFYDHHDDDGRSRRIKAPVLRQGRSPGTPQPHPLPSDRDQGGLAGAPKIIMINMDVTVVDMSWI